MVVLAEIVLPPTAHDSFILKSVLLASVGTLYLASDLLGRQHGPLQWLTLLISCGLVSALVLSFVGTIVDLLQAQSFRGHATLQSLIVGGLIGVFTVVLVDFPTSWAKPPILSRRGSAVGLALGLIFFFTALLLLQGNLHVALVMGLTSAALASLRQWRDHQPLAVHPLGRRNGASIARLFPQKVSGRLRDRLYPLAHVYTDGELCCICAVPCYPTASKLAADSASTAHCHQCRNIGVSEL